MVQRRRFRVEPGGNAALPGGDAPHRRRRDLDPSGTGPGAGELQPDDRVQRSAGHDLRPVVEQLSRRSGEGDSRRRHHPSERRDGRPRAQPERAVRQEPRVAQGRQDRHRHAVHVPVHSRRRLPDGVLRSAAPPRLARSTRPGGAGNARRVGTGADQLQVRGPGRVPADLYRQQPRSRHQPQRLHPAVRDDLGLLPGRRGTGALRPV